MSESRIVLVADDDPNFREIVTEVLTGAGYKVDPVSDGQEGWEHLDARGADMAVLDLNMPRMDGLQLTKKIRQDARFKDMPILLLTIRALVEEQVAGYDRGADDYLTKPFENKMLVARLKVLERRILK
ncbi:MAG: response regulator [Elusimicrobia bacterium]|nr:response regulator [Elusimicrobiota bacterium]